MKLLYITRKYPPMVGGMEKLSYGLAQEFQKHTDLTLISWGGSQKFLPIIFPYFFLLALFLVPIKKIDHVHIGDSLLSPIGLFLKKIYAVKISITVMGLDIIWGMPIYKSLIPKIVAGFDKIICISYSTMKECVKRGISAKKITVIPPGINPQEYKVSANRSDLENILNSDLKDKKVFITVGRLVKRKGVVWFIENVLPKLNKNVIYVVIGEGEEKDKIEKVILKNNLAKRVFLLGKISEEKLKIIYNTADLFVMPNYTVKGTMEGFGIVAVEASAAGLPVVASNIEGIQDAIINNKTGILTDPLNIESFLKSINSALKLNKKEIIKTVEQNYSWPLLGQKYLKAIS